jgi:hypothetical protein
MLRVDGGGGGGGGGVGEILTLMPSSFVITALAKDQVRRAENYPVGSTWDPQTSHI